MYNLGGGAVWYARPEQRAAVLDELRSWTVRFETGANRSDWLHEREWRIPVPRANPVLPAYGVPVILVGDPHWQPTPRLVPHTFLVDQFGVVVDPGGPGQPQVVQVPALPSLWTAALQRWYWDPVAQRIVALPG